MSAEPRRCPSQTPTRQRTSESTELAPALNHWPFSARFRVCKLKEEKVVYPPQIPNMKNCRNVAGAIQRMDENGVRPLSRVEIFSGWRRSAGPEFMRSSNRRRAAAGAGTGSIDKGNIARIACASARRP